jgi:hypothetical protein
VDGFGADSVGVEVDEDSEDVNFAVDSDAAGLASVPPVSEGLLSDEPLPLDFGA